ncbi:MAG: 3-oxoacyl-[acyl-carrier-protein] reductase [Bacteroidetes bacterium]|jgi:3-oxoacyl-[acyl-carrier protein] reductase|nr:3-oxoacyl-[acyl-carrier-protein] reductase [Bacteroidota bacterium]MBT4401621.1 3-oxoacyl-[acyl-carrier-protein] reductase [Bacteroidota bacterium]MBT4410165.1 3-oxoacyl-[acyl-carrier-protein] reductase [Bacteroidota bacterium]MBT7093054.1 3-oxoacyl-[acyl-carrier-protein] reductase [Bacteroidota bacterium]MBT7464686.1 3-oxoacyl-[acyl-carrier-protein] reductase [Bacteroidota bacterium]
MGLLEGKTALITGASRGIGKALAERFADEGANLILTDLFYDENAKALEADLSAKGVKVKMYASDASKFDDAQKLVDEAMKDFDGIHILVNNAGITRDTLLLRMTEEQWDMVINVNLKSAFNLTKAVQRTMIKQREGSIINMSSVVGVGGNAGQANYSASKAGMIGFTKSVAKELGSRSIRCNAIAPGFILTEMTDKLGEDVKKAWADQIPLRRGGTADEVAKVAVFLGSDLSSYVSGQVVQVCGAMMT